jgi:hypothetical protein
VKRMSETERPDGHYYVRVRDGDPLLLLEWRSDKNMWVINGSPPAFLGKGYLDELPDQSKWECVRPYEGRWLG